MGNVVVVGSLHLDVLVNAPDRPRKGETIAGYSWGLQAGGKGGNQAVHAARQGANTTMIGRVGKDDFGDKLLTALEKNGVHTQHVMVDDSAGSGMSVAIIDNQGDYGAVIVSGVNRHITLADLESADDVLDQADCVVLQYEIPLETVWAIAKLSHSKNKTVILNAAPAYPTTAEDLHNISILVVNEIEAQMLSGLPTTTIHEIELAAKKLNEDVPVVIATLGERGVVVAQRDQAIHHIDAYSIDLVDTHGAGDAFIGGLAARLSTGDNLMPAVQYANATAALTCMGRGPQPDNVTVENVQSLLNG